MRDNIEHTICRIRLKSFSNMWTKYEIVTYNELCYYCFQWSKPSPEICSSALFVGSISKASETRELNMKLWRIMNSIFIVFSEQLWNFVFRYNYANCG